MVSQNELLQQQQDAFECLVQDVKKIFMEPEFTTTLTVSVLDRLPSVRPPLLKEGNEASKAIAKASFRGLAAPAQNLVFGLTEVETTISRCRALKYAEVLETLQAQLQSSLDSYQTLSNVLQDRVLHQFQECEQRLVTEWTEKVPEQKVADAAQKVTSFVKDLDAYAIQFANSHESIQEMQVDLRSWDSDVNPMTPSNNVYNLQKKTLETYVHARECYEFLKRQSLVKQRRIQIQSDMQSLTEDGTQKAKGRLGLHSLQEDRREGKVVPNDAKDLDQWTSNLTKLREAEDSFMQQLDRKSERETVRSGFKDTDWTRLSDLLNECETLMKDLQQQTSAIKISLTHRQRKLQKNLWEPQNTKLSKIKYPKIDVHTSFNPDLEKLNRAKQLMIDELSKLQKTFSFRMTDIDVIFQSVSSGIELSEQSKIFEASREMRLNIEKQIRSLAEFQIKMSAILC